MSGGVAILSMVIIICYNRGYNNSGGYDLTGLRRGQPAISI